MNAILHPSKTPPAAALPRNPESLSDNGPADPGPIMPSGPVVSVQAETRGLSIGLAPASGFEDFGKGDRDHAFQSQIVFFETALSYGNNDDPRLTFLLVNAYLSACTQTRGIGFFDTLLTRYGKAMTTEMHAIHLAAVAILRATIAEQVPLLRRIQWVRRTITLLDEAVAKTDGTHPLTRWARGLVYAQLPGFFFKKATAYADLTWLADRPETEPLSGFYREVYRHLARLHRADGNREQADAFLKRSGYDSYQPRSMLMGWFTSTRSDGATMAATPWLETLADGRVFAVHGFGYSELHFVTSTDGKHLIAIDAGTQPFSAENAEAFLRKSHPKLPPLTSVVVTHAHWDHVGGHGYFRQRYPDARFYGRANYRETVGRVLRTHSYEQFRGTGFENNWVSDYAPDVEITERADISIGGTAIELVPIAGGETEDALLVHLPELGVVFAGDALMPYFGEPWVREGSVDDALCAIDEIAKRNPVHLLHGHHPLTLMYRPEVLDGLREALAWLITETRVHAGNGYSARDIVRLNLVPPMLAGRPDIYLGYIAARDHLIARVVDGMVGIWREDRTGRDPEGLDTLTSEDYGRALEHYFKLDIGNTASMLRRMVRAGDNELALKFATAAETRFGASPAIRAAMEEAADQLRSASQFIDPFKFVTYSEIIGREHPPIGH